MWAGGGDETEGPGLVDDLKAFGAPPEIIAQAQEQERLEVSCDVWPENWQAVNLFLDLGTQWNVGMAGPVGLRYEAALAYLRLKRVADRASMMDNLRIMETAALRQFVKSKGASHGA